MLYLLQKCVTVTAALVVVCVVRAQSFEDEDHTEDNFRSVDLSRSSSDLVESLKQKWVAVHQALKESSENIRKEVENEIIKHKLYLESGKDGLKKTISEAQTQSVADVKALLDSWVTSEKKLANIIRSVTALTADGTKNLLSEFAYVKTNVSNSLDTLPLNLAIQVGQLLETWLDSGKDVMDTSDKAIEKSKLGVDKLLDLISESQKNLTESAENVHLNAAVGIGKLLESLMDSGKDLSNTLDEAQAQTKAGTDKILNTLTEALSKLPKITEDAVKVTVDNLANQQPDIVLV